MYFYKPDFQQIITAKCGKQLDLSTAQVMGILNVTPDSFSDGGRHNTVDAALRHTERMIADGASIIDIGGESTRPNAAVVPSDTEIARVLPVVSAIRSAFGDDIWLSLDTSNPVLMTEGIDAGADIINDVRGLSREGAIAAAAATDAPVVLMHSRGEPTTMNHLADYDDVISDINAELGACIDAALAGGISREKIIIDIGMGFAKNYQQHIQVMQHLSEFIEYFKMPMLFGVSRKRFLGELLSMSGMASVQNHTPLDRDLIGAGIAMLAVQAGAGIVRVHDVAGAVQMIAMYQQLRG